MAENKSNIISEEQRKLIVQANGLGQQKMYEDAIAYYYKALEINSLSYPPAYFNIALLQAQNREVRSGDYVHEVLPAFIAWCN
jgi:tetratricopeptide (TPR) repeat protein